MNAQKQREAWKSMHHVCTAVDFLTFWSDLALSKSPAEALNSSTPSSSSICTNSLQPRRSKRETCNSIRPPQSSFCLTSAYFNLGNINWCMRSLVDINSVNVTTYTAGLTVACRSTLTGSKSKPCSLLTLPGTQTATCNTHNYIFFFYPSLCFNTETFRFVRWERYLRV